MGIGFLFIFLCLTINSVSGGSGTILNGTDKNEYELLDNPFINENNTTVNIVSHINEKISCLKNESSKNNSYTTKEKSTFLLNNNESDIDTIVKETEEEMLRIEQMMDAEIQAINDEINRTEAMIEQERKAIEDEINRTELLHQKEIQEVEDELNRTIEFFDDNATRCE